MYDKENVINLFTESENSLVEKYVVTVQTYSSYLKTPNLIGVFVG